MLIVACKYVAQSKYIDKTLAKQKQIYQERAVWIKLCDLLEEKGICTNLFLRR